MLDDAKVIAFIATRNGAKARQFYEGVLGLPVISDDAFALALDVHGTMLRVQKVAELTPAPFTALGWQVLDIRATVAALLAAGIGCQIHPGMAQDEQGIWCAPSGALVAWFKDPDGNMLSLT